MGDIAFYEVTAGQTPTVSDVNQFTKVFEGNADAGSIIFADPIANPTTAIGSYTTGTGGNIAAGNYNYSYSFVTGIVKGDGSLQIAGETVIASNLAVTVAANNSVVNLSSIPTPASSLVVAKRIYRTVVGGAGSLKLVATILASATSYTDTIADGSLGAVAQNTNTTGTRLMQYPLIVEVYPWMQSINVFHSYQNSNFDTLSSSTVYLYNMTKQSTGAQGAYFECPVSLSAGTWVVEIIGTAGNNVGIYHFKLDGVQVTTIDGYSAPTTYNVRLTSGNFVVGVAGKKLLRISMDTKNATSTNYFGILSALQLRRVS